MSKAAMAILDHYKEDTLHDHYPPGKGSWCSFQRDLVRHHGKSHPTIV